MFAIIVDDLWNFCFLILALVVIISVLIPEMSGVLFLGLFGYAAQFIAVDRVNREVKREANSALSPLLTVIAETVHGRRVARVLGCERFFEERT